MHFDGNATNKIVYQIFNRLFLIRMI